MEGYSVLLIFEDYIDQDFSVWHHQPTKMPMKCFVSRQEWHTTPSPRQHFQLRGFSLKVHKASPVSSAGAGGCVESQTGFCRKSKRAFLFSVKTESNLPENKRVKTKKISIAKQKGAISCDWRRGQMGCGSAHIDAEATGGLKSMQKKTQKKSHERQKHPDTNQIKATFHQFARFWLHLSQFWVQASSSMCWKDSKTQTFISFAERKKAFRSC